MQMHVKQSSIIKREEAARARRNVTDERTADRAEIDKSPFFSPGRPSTYRVPRYAVWNTKEICCNAGRMIDSIHQGSFRLAFNVSRRLDASSRVGNAFSLRPEAASLNSPRREHRARAQGGRARPGRRCTLKSAHLVP